MKKLIRSFGLLFTFLILFSFSQVFAQSKDVVLRNVQTDALQYKAGEEITGQFTMTNLLGSPQSDLYYVVRVGNSNDGKVSPVFFESERFGPLSLSAKSSEVVKYALPAEIIYPQAGVEIILQKRNGDILERRTVPVNVTGVSNLVNLQENSVEFILREEGKETRLSSGDIYDLGVVEESAQILFQIKETQKEGQTVTFVEYSGGIGGDIVRGGNESLDVAQGEDQRIDLNDKPGIYLLRVYAQNVNVFYDFTYIVAGEVATISSIETPISPLQTNDTFEIEVFFSGGDYSILSGDESDLFSEESIARDDVAASEDESVVASLEQSGFVSETDTVRNTVSAQMISGTILTRLKNQQGNIIIEQSRPITLGQDTDSVLFSFDSQRALGELELEVVILNMQNQVLAEDVVIIVGGEQKSLLEEIILSTFILIVLLFIILLMRKRKTKEIILSLIVGGVMLNSGEVSAQISLMTDNQCTVEEAQLPGCQEIYKLQGSEIPDQEDRVSATRIAEIAKNACQDAGYSNAVRATSSRWYKGGLWKGPIEVVCASPVKCGYNLCQYQSPVSAPETKVISSIKDLLTSVNSNLESRGGICYSNGRDCSFGSYSSDQILNTHTNRKNLCHLAGYRDYETFTDQQQTSFNAVSVLVTGGIWKNEGNLNRFPVLFDEIREVTPGGKTQCNDEFFPASCTSQNVGSSCYMYESSTVPLESLPFCSLNQNSFNDGDAVVLTCTGLPSGTILGMSGATCETQGNGDITCTGVAGSGTNRVDAAERNRISVDYPGSTAGVYTCGIEKNPVRVVETLTCKDPIIDACSNLEGYQPVAPDGYVQELDGSCRLVDMCPNTTIIENEIPDGFILDDGGNCVLDPSEENACPVGSFRNAAGECVGNTGGSNDLCLNIDEVQTTVPDGLVRNSAGDCLRDTSNDNLCSNRQVRNASGNCPDIPGSGNECILNNGNGPNISITSEDYALASGQLFQVGLSVYQIGALNPGNPRTCNLISNDVGLTLKTTQGFIEPGDVCEIDIVAGGITFCKLELVDGVLDNPGSVCQAGTGTSSQNPCILVADSTLSLTLSEGKITLNKNTGSVLVTVECGLDGDANGVFDGTPLRREAVCNLTPNIGEF